MTDEETSVPEEIVELSYFFLPHQRQTAIDSVLRALQADPHLEFLLAVFEVSLNDRHLSPSTPPSRGLLRKLLQALDEPDGVMLLYTSPYNDLGLHPAAEEEERRLEFWDLEIADRLCEFGELRSVRAFLEHGTGSAAGRNAVEARALHDQLLGAIVGSSGSYSIWACTDVRSPGQGGPAPCGPSEGVWPAEQISPWFHGVFWDDLIFVLNPPESTLTVLALTSA